MIYVTHDQVEAMTMADRICVLRDGMIEQVGTPLELYEDPQSLFVAGFIGSPKMNLLTASWPRAWAPRRSGCAASISTSCRTAAPGNGTVIHAENLGSDTYVYVDAGGEEPLVVRVEGTAKYHPGDRVSLKPRQGKVYTFDAAGKPLQRQ